MSSSRFRRVLRTIALYKLAKSTALVLLALAAWELARGDALAQVVAWARGLPLVEGHIGFGHAIGAMAGLAPARIELAGAVALAYAALCATEGWGLWQGRRWAEILTIVATAKQPVGLWLAGLQIRLRGPFLCRLLANRTTIGLRTVKKLSSRSQIFASTPKARQAAS